MNPVAKVTLFLAIASICSLRAPGAIVTLSFSGTYDTTGDTGAGLPVFGLSGTSVPYNFRITYDTALDTNNLFLATGAILDGGTTTHDFHGYSASGIIATDLQFGDQTWTAADLAARGVGGFVADLWFDTDISVATPTRSWIYFEGGSPSAGYLDLGGGPLDGAAKSLRQESFAGDSVGLGVSTLMTITSIPEPSMSALCGAGAVGVLRRRRAHMA